jgi:hypothetical protein
VALVELNKSFVFKTDSGFPKILGILLLARSSTRALAFNFYFLKVQVKINQAAMVSTGTPKAKETDCKDHSDGSLLEMKVKTEHEQSEDSMEMLAYFDKLPDNTREELLNFTYKATHVQVRLQSCNQRRILKSIGQRWTMQGTQTNQGYMMISLRLNAKRHLTGNTWARFLLFKLNRAFSSLSLIARIETLVTLKLFFANKITAPNLNQETSTIKAQILLSSYKVQILAKARTPQS